MSPPTLKVILKAHPEYQIWSEQHCDPRTVFDICTPLAGLRTVPILIGPSHLNFLKKLVFSYL